MDVVKSHEERAINEVIEKVLSANIWLQLMGQDVAKPFLQGKPGGGKTASLLNMCKQNGWNIFHLHLPLIPLEDLSGLPETEEIKVNGENVKGTRWTFPEILTEIYKRSTEIIINPKTKKQEFKPCVVLLDDMHLASPGHLALGFELFSEKKLRTYKIPDNVAFVLAGNASSKAGTKTQNSAILNRLCIFPVNTNFEFWRNSFAYQNGVNSKITAFLSRDSYRQFFHEEETVNSPWGSPRAWTYLSTMLNAMESVNNGEVNQQDLAYIAAGHVSGTATSEFVSFYHIYSKTEMDKIFSGQREINAPKEELEKYVYMIAAANEYVNRTRKNPEKEENQKYVDILCKVVCAIAESNSEIAISGFKTILDMETGIKNNAPTSYIKLIQHLQVIGSSTAKKVRADLAKVAGNSI